MGCTRRGRVFMSIFKQPIQIFEILVGLFLASSVYGQEISLFQYNRFDFIELTPKNIEIIYNSFQGKGFDELGSQIGFFQDEETNEKGIMTYSKGNIDSVYQSVSWNKNDNILIIGWLNQVDSYSTTFRLKIELRKYLLQSTDLVDFYKLEIASSKFLVGIDNDELPEMTYEVIRVSKPVVWP